jgi:hypothetical protein
MRDSVFFAVMMSIVAMLTFSAYMQAARCVGVHEHNDRFEEAYYRGYAEGLAERTEAMGQ